MRSEVGARAAGMTNDDVILQSCARYTQRLDGRRSTEVGGGYASSPLPQNPPPCARTGPPIPSKRQIGSVLLHVWQIPYPYHALFHDRFTPNLPVDMRQNGRLVRTVVLLTGDRNLRLKAHSLNIATRDPENFARWVFAPAGDGAL